MPYRVVYISMAAGFSVFEIRPDADLGFIAALKTMCEGSVDSGVDEDTVRRDFNSLRKEWDDYVLAKTEGRATEWTEYTARILFVAQESDGAYAGFCMARYPHWMLEDPNMSPLEWLIRNALGAGDQWSNPKLRPKITELIQARIASGKTLQTRLDAISAEEQQADIDNAMDALSPTIRLFSKSEEDTEEDYARYLQNREKKLIKYATFVCTLAYDPSLPNDQLAGSLEIDPMTRPLSSFDIFVDLLCVSPSKRGQYVGDFLLQALAAKTADLAPRFHFATATITLTPATTQLIRYYSKLGFKAVGTRGESTFMRTGNLLVHAIKPRTRVL